MRRGHVLSAMLAGVGLFGCAGDATKTQSAAATVNPPADSVCTQGACRASVSVRDCVVTINPEPLPVDGANNIFWEMDGASVADYSFTADGVVIPDYHKQFTNYGPFANNKKFKVHNNNTVKGPFYYMINVAKKDATRCPTHDPWIFNR